MPKLAIEARRLKQYESWGAAFFSYQLLKLHVPLLIKPPLSTQNGLEISSNRASRPGFAKGALIQTIKSLCCTALVLWTGPSRSGGIWCYGSTLAGPQATP